MYDIHLPCVTLTKQPQKRKKGFEQLSANLWLLFAYLSRGPSAGLSNDFPVLNHNFAEVSGSGAVGTLLSPKRKANLGLISFVPRVPATEPRNPKFPKWLGEGAKGVLVHMDQKPVRLVQKRVALVLDRVALVQETFGRLFLQLAKTPFAPSPNHFRDF